MNSRLRAVQACRSDGDTQPRKPIATAASSPSRISPASGKPYSAASCRAMLWVWSKNATGLCGKGVIDHTKLNAPTPVPNQGCAWIIAQALAQIFPRELLGSPCRVFLIWSSP